MPGLNRREALRRMGLAAAALLTGCTPLRMTLGLYPGHFKDNPGEAARALELFLGTVVPGADPGAGLSRVFFDRDYPLHDWAAFLAQDLCDRCATLHGTSWFAEEGPGRRAAVIRSGLAAADPLPRLYRGAILLAQVAAYASIYDDEAGCPAIDFPGANYGFDPAETSYPDPERFRTREITAAGSLA